LIILASGLAAAFFEKKIDPGLVADKSSKISATKYRSEQFAFDLAFAQCLA
jgi:hypothetical protein